MSGLYENQKTVRSLRAMIEDVRPQGSETYFFVLGHPRSDIGKGTLVAQLLACTPGSDAIKFDGLLNTNENGRHTAVGHDDFGVYERFNSGRSWGREHYLLGGELYRDFINEFGENENLQINPHLSLYVEYRIHKMWQDVGRPKHFFIEVGGLLADPEVDPIFTPIIQRLGEDGLGKVIMLTEMSWNGEHIKTKAAQSAVQELASRHIRPWCVVVRDAPDITNTTWSERLEFERVISAKIFNSFNFRLMRVISVPYFANLQKYTEYIIQRFRPFLSRSESNNIVIATGNDAKFADFRLYLDGRHYLQQSREMPQRVEVPEGISSIEDNAIAKARAWAVTTGQLAIGDDTGFFMRELNGEPGVALRRWGGELGEDATHEDFWHYLQDKTKNLRNLGCYFEQCIAIVSPNGEMRIIRNRNEGVLNREKLQLPYNGSGYPLGAAFESNAREQGKTWDSMTDQEKRDFDKELIAKIANALDSLSRT